MGRAYRMKRRAIARRSCVSAEEARSVHANVGQLAQFCLSHGCSNIKHFRPFNFADSGRGLQTLKPLKPGDTLITLPRSLLITTSVALKVDELKRAIDRSELKPTAVELLCAFLLFEKSKEHKSYWREYLQSLPATFTTLLYINPEDLLVLDHKLAAKYKSMSSKVTREFNEMNSIFSWSIGLVTYDEFLWAWHVANTRCVFMAQPTLEEVRTTSDELDNFALAPFLDLLNHSPEAQAVYGYNKETDSFHIVTHQQYNKYDQVFITYSNHSNRSLLLEYGFCIADNVDDCIEFDFDEVTDLLIPKHTEARKQLESANLNCGFVCDYQGLSWNLLEALKLLGDRNDLDLSEQDCTDLLVSKSANKRLECLSRIARLRCDNQLQRTTDELFILDMLVVLYENEVDLLLDAENIEKSRPDESEILEHAWDHLCNISITD